LKDKEINSKKQIFSWSLYDWANSVFSLVITSTLFPVYWGLMARNQADGPEIQFLGIPVINSALFSFAVSASFLVSAFLSPFLSALADIGGYRRRFLMAFCTLGALATALLYFFEKGQSELGIFLFSIGTIGYSGSIVFYNSFLPEICKPSDYGKVSGQGFAYGYIGSVLLLVMVLLPLFIPDFPFEGGLSFEEICRIAFVLTGIWWFGFGLISVSGLPTKRDKQKWNISASKVIMRLSGAFFDSLEIKGLPVYLIGFFLMNMGVQTVMYLAAIFGDAELHLSSEKLIATIVILQLLAILGSVGFARLSLKINPLTTLIIACSFWALICIMAFFVQTDLQFYGIAALVGLVMGGSQSLLRSTFTHFVPKEEIGKSALYGFFDVIEKIAIVLGTFLFGFINQMTGSMRYSVLPIILLFLGAIFVFKTIRKTNWQNQKS
jgi:UMF1 family MFS transporter